MAAKFKWKLRRNELLKSICLPFGILFCFRVLNIKVPFNSDESMAPPSRVFFLDLIGKMAHNLLQFSSKAAFVPTLSFGVNTSDNNNLLALSAPFWA